MSSYQHQWQSGERIALPFNKAVCVGRNYALHAKELNNPIPDAPILFIKPSTAFVSLAPSFIIPKDTACHHEIELSILIGKSISHADEQLAQDAILGVGLGLDLTLRDRQQQLKEKGHPWELAKAFDGSLPLGAFIPLHEMPSADSWQFDLVVNGVCRQRGHVRDMITGIVPLLMYISRYFTLQPGDVVMTGTPAGVAALNAGDALELHLNQSVYQTTSVC